jgi:molybdate transport system substrate-binding protein
MPLRLFLCLAVAFALAGPARADDRPVSVFAAASLKEALDEIAGEFAAATGHRAVVTLAGSSALARQIQAGAPADIFVSASGEWMDVLERDGLVAPGSRFDLAGNRLVLIAHGGTGPAAADPPALTPDFDLVGRLGTGRLAVALTEAVPAGVYARAGLTALGLWDGVADRLAQTDNVRAALMLVALGEAPLGVVYATDAIAEPRVGVIAVFPAGSHEPIVYPAARIAGPASAAADAFLAWLRGPAAAAALARHGFVAGG